MEKYLKDAVLNDSSVGRKFVGHKGIREYYNSYFIGYKTQTKLVKLVIQDTTTHMKLEFTDEFQEGKLGGLFDFTFNSVYNKA